MNKKILAVLMALMMVLTSAVAFAAPNNTTAVIEEIDFDLSKTYTGEGAPAETFTFEVKKEGDQLTYPLTLSDETIEFDGPQAAAKTVTVSVPAVGKDEGQYPAKPGTYTYTIIEKVENPTAGIEYDETEYAVKVTVYNDATTGDPVYKTTISIKDGNTKTTEAAFENVYSATSMTVKKQITGNAANLEDTFEITVTFSNPSDANLKSLISATQTAGEGVTIDSTDNRTFVLSGIGHNDVVTFRNLPVGTVYSVVETPNEYNADYSDKGADRVVAANAGTNVVVTNDKTDTIDTGVNTDSMPYIMLMAFVMILAAAVVLKKRSVNE